MAQSVTQQKRHLQRMCTKAKQVIGREKGTKEERKPPDNGSDVGGEDSGAAGRCVTRMLTGKKKKKCRHMMCLQRWTCKWGKGTGHLEQIQRRTFLFSPEFI